MNYENFQPEGEKPEGLKEKVIRYPGGISREKFFSGEERMRKKAGVGSTVAGFIFVAWFIMSIVLMVHVFKDPGNANLGVAIFGQVFFVFGIAALCSRVKMGIIFALVGGAMCVGGLFHRFSDDPEMQAMLIENVLPLGLCLIFPLVGIGMLVYTYKNLILRKMHCTLPVMAQSTYLDREIVHVSRGDNDSAPVLMWVLYFRYYYNCKYYYCDCVGISASKPKPSLGECKEIRINPNNPEEYWSDASGKLELILMLTLGIVFTVAGSAALYMLMQNL